MCRNHRSDKSVVQRAPYMHWRTKTRVCALHNFVVGRDIRNINAFSRKAVS